MLRIIDPREVGDSDIVGVGEDLRPETLIWAYRNGIFPWPMRGLPLLWYSPMERAVIEFSRLHVPRSLARIRRQCRWTFTINRAFDSVIAGCQQSPRPDQDGTWITPAMHDAYTALHHAGYAHSVETWDEEGALAGGLYGVAVDGVFTGESLFYRRPNASKLALLFWIDHLRSRGLGWIDIEVMTPHMEALGATLISRDTFLDRLSATQALNLTLLP